MKAVVTIINASSILGIIPTPTCKDSRFDIPAIFAPIPQPSILPIIATLVIITAKTIMETNEDERASTLFQMLEPTHTKNRGIKKPYAIALTSFSILKERTFCPIKIPATNAPIIPEIPALSAKNA